MKMYFVRIVKVRACAKSFKDARHVVTRHTVEYRDNHLGMYRKSFEVKGDKKPSIPMSGTHNSINSKKYQWL